MSTNDDPKPARRRPWGRIILALSLGLNLLVAGLVLGHGMRRPPPGGGAPIERAGGPFVRALPEQDRRILGQALRARETDMRDSRRALRDSFQTLLGELRRDGFDPDRVRALLDEQQQLLARRGALFSELLVQRLGALSPQERAAFADRLERDIKRHKPR